MAIGDSLHKMLEKDRDNEEIIEKEDVKENENEEKLNEEKEENKAFYQREGNNDAMPLIEKMIKYQWSTGKKKLKEAHRCFGKLIECTDVKSNKFLRDMDESCSKLHEKYLKEKNDKEVDENKKGKCGGSPVGSQSGPQDGSGPGSKKKNEEIKKDFEDNKYTIVDDKKIDQEKEGILGLNKYMDF